MTPRVTVLLPVYAGAPYLRGAIDSVLRQTFDDFELLVVDDASPDESAEIVAAYPDPRIRLVRNDRNLGQVGSLNRGLAEALGEYVARLDQDDVCLPQRLERQVAVLDAEPTVAVVGAWIDQVDDSGAIVGRVDGRVDDFVEFVALLLSHQLPLAHPSVTFRREEALAAGGYDERVRLAEDQALWRRLALRRREARIVPEVLLRYRVHEAQQSHRRYAEQLANSMLDLEAVYAELAPRAPVRGLRLLLTGDPALLELGRDEAQALGAALDPFAESAAARLGMRAGEAAKLDRLLRKRVATVARRAWREDPHGFRRATPPLARAAGTGRATYAAVYATAPLLRAARRVRRNATGSRR